MGYGAALKNLADAWIIVFGVSIVLNGAAVAYSDAYPQWLGWLALLLGIGVTAIGLTQAYNGPSALVTNTLFGAFSVGVTVWLLVMGILMWRKATASP